MTIQARRIVHLNLSVGSLPAALPLFTDQLGFDSHPLGAGKLLPGETVGATSRAHCSGRVIQRPQAPGQCALELLEWQQPVGNGLGSAEPWHAGISRLAVRVADADAMRARLVSAGVKCFAGPVTGAVSGERFFCCANDDGSVLQLVEQAGPLALHFININCTDLMAASRWYQQALGFEPESDIWDETFPGEVFGLRGAVHTRSQRLTLCDRETDCIIQLQQWLEPATAAPATAGDIPLGFHRIALAVDDIDDSYQQLAQQGVECYQAAVRSGIESTAAEAQVLLFKDPDGNWLELLQASGSG